MTNAIDEYFKLKAQLGEPILELETESSVNEKRKGRPPKTEVAPKLNKVVEQVTKRYDFKPVLKMIETDKKRLIQRRNELYQELENLDIKISGLDYVEEKLTILNEGTICQ